MDRPITIEPALPHAALPNADWADCYQLQIKARELTAEAAARLAFGRFPVWIRMLMRVRDTAAVLVGLKPSTIHSPETTDMVGIFPVISRSAEQMVLGIDDRHLDFRLVVDVDKLDEYRQTIRVTTLVDRKILLGRFYIAVITPFHKLVVGSALSTLGKRLALN